MPLLAENGAPAADIVPPDGMRDRFLSRIASEELVNEMNGGSRLHAFLLKKLPSSTFGKEQGGEERKLVEAVLSEPKPRQVSFLWRAAAVRASFQVFVATGFVCR